MSWTPPVALTIAGSDSGGGAGIQADLKTFSALGVYGASAITAITAQNTVGVSAVHAVPVAIVEAQIAAVLADLPVGAIKIGMLATAEIIGAVARALGAIAIPIVLDPVMVATSGDRLIADDAVGALVRELLPRAVCVTPNLHEAAVLTGGEVAGDAAAMESQARAILALGARAVLIKGGHGTSAESVDLLVSPAGTRSYGAARVATRNTHGTGCSLSSAIAAGFARGLTLEAAVSEAKDWLSGAIAAARDMELGRGHGPVHHFHRFWRAP
jgi:hydroxymethylpyrimidine/phosphomethylpyrimidine kinase